MILGLVLQVVLAAAVAQAPQSLSSALEWGKQVFDLSCATGYCHAINGGAGGGGARLAARGFTQEYIREVTRTGRPGTAMSGFETRLSAQDLNAVVAYVARLNGVANPVIDTARTTVDAGVPKLSARAAEGRALFHDALRAFDRCATCHQVGGSGVPVAEPMRRIPANAAALRTLVTPQVASITVAGDTMPGLVVSRSESRALFYDLSVPPPVLRTLAPDQLSIAPDSRWRHASVLDTYSDAELELILQFLRETAGP